MVGPNSGASPNARPNNPQSQQANGWRELEKLQFGQSIETDVPRPDAADTAPTDTTDNQSEQAEVNSTDPTQVLDFDEHPELQRLDTAQTQAEQANQPESQKSFTQQELERIAYLVQDSENNANISADSQIVKDINLKIKYDQYQKLKQQIEAAQQRKQQSNAKISDSVQFSTFEDLDTAKRELEEAMYIANPKFAQIDKEQKRHALKDKATYGEMPERDGTQEALRARVKYRQIVDAKAEKRQIIYDEKRRIEAEKMSQQLDDISQQIGETEEYKEYSAMAKGDYATPDLKQRRQGVENAGSDGLFGKKGTRNVESIDWVLSPHNPDSLNPEDDADRNESEPDEDREDEDDKDDKDDREQAKNSVNLGDTELHPEKKDLDPEKQERVQELKEALDKMTPELAELYAKTRRLVVGSENYRQFEKMQAKYQETLDEYTQLKAEASYEQGKQEIFDQLGDRIDELGASIEQGLIDFCGGDPANTDKTQEEVDAERERLKREAEQTLNEEYLDQVAELRGQVSAQFTEDYIEQSKQLEDATIDKLDNGTACRKVVSKVLKNKWLKRGLLVAGAVGLAVTGVGLAAGVAAGTAAVGLSFTAGGVAFGAAKGGLMGSLMSRQDSKTSAVREFSQLNSDKIRERLEGVDILDPNSNAGQVGEWMMEEYKKENDADRSSNRKRTAISAGIGALIGGAMSGIQVDEVTHGVTTEQVQTGTTPDTYNVDMSQIDIHRGSGMSETFSDLGGDPSNLQQAIGISQQYDASYGMVPGSNGEVAGAGGAVGNFAHTYPGTIDTWPAAARNYITQVAQKWAAAGLIPAEKIAGSAIFSPIEVATTNYMPNAFMNFLTQAVAALGAGAVGQAIGNKGAKKSQDRAPQTPQSTPNTPISEEPPQPQPETQPQGVGETETTAPQYGLSEVDLSIVRGERQLSDTELQSWWSTQLNQPTRRFLTMVALSDRDAPLTSSGQPEAMAPALKQWIRTNVRQ